MPFRSAARALRHAAILLLLAAPAVRAQSDSADRSAPACLGFSFGRWTPALDWRAGGHGARPDSSRLQRAPAGRDWATNGTAGERDASIILFPAWWPAGVGVDLPTREPAPGDTVVGRAHAFVADGRVTTPTASVRAWRVACGAQPGKNARP